MKLDSFYEASASVAGALIGLLFVAISVARTDHRRDSEPVHRVRASTSLTAFLNALAVSLFTLIEGERSGSIAIVVAIGGLLFVAASVISLRHEPHALRDVVFLVSILVAFIAELVAGIEVNAHQHDIGYQHDVAILVVVFFLIGIPRAWELVEGPAIGLRRELTDVAREVAHRADDHDEAEEQKPAPE